MSNEKQNMTSLFKAAAVEATKVSKDKVKSDAGKADTRKLA